MIRFTKAYKFDNYEISFYFYDNRTGSHMYCRHLRVGRDFEDLLDERNE